MSTLWYNRNTKGPMAKAYQEYTTGLVRCDESQY